MINSMVINKKSFVESRRWQMLDGDSKESSQGFKEHSNHKMTMVHRYLTTNETLQDGAESAIASVFNICPPTAAIYSFGDSLADTGNVEYVFPYTTPAEHLPYGEQNPFRKPSFRYSDGRLVIDFIG